MITLLHHHRTCAAYAAGVVILANVAWALQAAFG